MKKFLLLVILVVLIGAGCKEINVPKNTSETPNNPVLDNNKITSVSETDQVQTEEPNTQVVQKTEIDEIKNVDLVNKYTGVIKKFATAYGSYEYYVESNNKQIGLKVCDQPYGGLNTVMQTLSANKLSVDVYGTPSEGGLCLAGIVADFGKKLSKQTGEVKEFSDGGYGSFMYYVENGDTKTGLNVCDTRVGGFNDMIINLAKTRMLVDVYGTLTNGGMCVTGMVLTQ